MIHTDVKLKTFAPLIALSAALCFANKGADLKPVLTSPANRNSIIQVFFKLDGGKAFHLSYKHAKSHLFRVIVIPVGISINKDKNLQDPKATAGVLARSETPFEAGKWYTLMVEVSGSKVTVQTDNGVRLRLAIQASTRIRSTTAS